MGRSAESWWVPMEPHSITVGSRQPWNACSSLDGAGSVVCTLSSLCSHFANLFLKPPQPQCTRFAAIRFLLCTSWTFPPFIAVFLIISFIKHWHPRASQPWMILRQNHHCHSNGDGELAQDFLPAHCATKTEFIATNKDALWLTSIHLILINWETRLE